MDPDLAAAMVKSFVRFGKPGIIDQIHSFVFNKMPDEALSLCNGVLLEEPRNTDVLLLKAQCLGQQCEFKSAALCLQRCENILGQDEEIDRVKEVIGAWYESVFGVQSDEWSIFDIIVNTGETCEAYHGNRKSPEDNNYLKESSEMFERKKEERKGAPRPKNKIKRPESPRDDAPIDIDIPDDKQICDNMPPPVMKEVDKIRLAEKFDSQGAKPGGTRKMNRKKRRHRKRGSSSAAMSSEHSEYETDSVTSTSTTVSSVGRSALSRCQLQTSQLSRVRNDAITDSRSRTTSGTSVDDGVTSWISQTSGNGHAVSSNLLNDVTVKIECPFEIKALCLTCWQRDGQQYGRNLEQPDHCSNPKEPGRHRWNVENKVFLMKSRKNGNYKWIRVRPLPSNISKLYPERLCRFVNDCRQGKKCPHPHSEEEKRLWSFQIRADIIIDEKLEQIISTSTGKLASKCRERNDSGVSSSSNSSLVKPGDEQDYTPQRVRRFTENHDIPAIYCHLCPMKEFHSFRMLDVHYHSKDHRQRLRVDDDRFWVHRPPPWQVKDVCDLEICPSVDRGDTFQNPGNTLCEMAHSLDEFGEWIERVKYRQIKINKEKSKDVEILSSTLQKLQECPNYDLSSEIVEELPCVNVHLQGQSYVQLTNINGNFTHQFTMSIEGGQGELNAVGLLLDPCRQFFSFDAPNYDGGPPNVQLIHRNDLVLTDGKLTVTVNFTTSRPGIYHQWVVFSFDDKPTLVKRLMVNAGQRDSNDDNMKLLTLAFTEPLVKTFGKCDEDNGQFPKYRAASLTSQMLSWWDYKPKTNSKHCYLYQLRRQLCLRELHAEYNISKLEVSGEISLSGKLHEGKGDASKETECIIRVVESDTKDIGYLRQLHQEGYVTDLIMSTAGGEERDSFRQVVQIVDENDSVARNPGDVQVRMKNSLAVETGFLDQFDNRSVVCKPQLNRSTFAKLDFSLSSVNHTDALFPDFGVLKDDIADLDRKQGRIFDIAFDTNQTRALIHICSDNTQRHTPILLCGPAGTGKSTLIDIAATIMVKKNHPESKKSRVLICTDSISCAVLHLRNALYYLSEAGLDKAVRLILFAPRDNILTYQTNEEFAPYIVNEDDFMKEEAVVKHLIVIATMPSSFSLLCKRMAGSFTHVFIDEAEEADEISITATLALSRSNGRVVLAGDPFQRTKCDTLAGNGDDDLLPPLARMIRRYMRSDNGRYFIRCMTKNYRSSNNIVDYMNNHLYGAVVLQSSTDSNDYDSQVQSQSVNTIVPMRRGPIESVDDYSIWQVMEVVFRAEELFRTWSFDFQENYEEHIGIIAEDAYQVDAIKDELTRRHLAEISVNTLESVQGKEFDVVMLVLSSVQNTSDVTSIHFRSLLARAMSRAKTMFTIVTSPNISTYSFNENQPERSSVLQAFFKHCVDQQSIYTVQKSTQLCDLEGTQSQEDLHIGADLVQLFSDAIVCNNAINDDPENYTDLRDVFYPIPEPCEDQQQDENNNTDDVLEDNYCDGYYENDDTWYQDESEYNSDEDTPPEDQYRHRMADHEESVFEEFSKEMCLKVLRSQPDKYKRCRLVTRKREKDKAIPVDEDLDFEIRIPNKLKRGRALNQDVVVIQLIDDENENGDPNDENEDGVTIRYGCVVGILEQKEKPQLKKVACTLDEYSDSLMVPIDGDFPKMIWWKEKTGKRSCGSGVSIPIYRVTRKGRYVLVGLEEVSNSERQHTVFITRFCHWDINNRYPMCVVIGILPKVTDLSSGVKYLKVKYGIKDSLGSIVRQYGDVKERQGSSTSVQREDLRNLLTFTIDPKDSKDLDDALSIEDMDNGNVQVGIHIADVASQVAIQSKLDEMAFKRATSYYPPDHEPVHMLPKKISTNVCSLVRNKVRDTLSYLFTISSIDGKVVDMKVSRATIRSKFKLSYEEAEEIINNQGGDVKTDQELKKRILALHEISQKRRKGRLGKSFFIRQSTGYGEDEDETPLSHQLVEDMMIMTNTEVAKWLLDHYPAATPIRRQLPPVKRKLEEWQQKYGELVNCSTKMSSLLAPLEKSDKKTIPPNLKILKEFVEVLEQAEKDGDFEKIKHLVCDDWKLPELYLMNVKYYGIQETAEYVCSDPQKSSDHFTLKTPAYLQCTSPIRRYMDLVVQRIITSVLENEGAPYSKQEVTAICTAYNQVEEKRRCFDKDCKELKTALQLQQHPVQTFAVVEGASETSIDLQVMKIHCIPSGERKVAIGSMKVAEKPKDSNHRVRLRWSEKIYENDRETNDFITVGASKKQVLPLRKDRHYISIDGKEWENFISKVLSGDNLQIREFVKRLVKNYRDSLVSCEELELTSERRDSKGNRIDPCRFTRQFELRDVLKIQVGTQLNKGSVRPSIDLVTLSEGFDICHKHRRDPVDCFSTMATQKIPGLQARNQWTIDSYQDTWLPILSMSSADNAIRSYENYFIHNVTIKWTTKPSVNGSAKGSFSVSSKFCRSRHIKFITTRSHDTHDYVCVRYQGGKTTTELNQSSGKQGLCSHQDYCWVGHCVVTGVLNKDDIVKVTIELKQFETNLLQELMKADGKFNMLCTVEILQKSTPDRRSEDAIHALQSADELVKALCLGKTHSLPQTVPRSCSIRQVILDVAKRWMDKNNNSNDTGTGRNFLNEDQTLAIRRALEQPFTVIQGPPGTGKSYTASYLAFAFKIANGKEKDLMNSKVLYCAPSNKAVDVAAGYLKTFDLKIIRMYSKSMEGKTYQVPGWNDGTYRRQGKEAECHPAHRDIALHHVIRQTSSKYGSQIRAFDNKFNKTNSAVSKKDYEEYTTVIAKAEKDALSNCDVILSTCSEAASRRLKDIDIAQCIIDEAGMCTEPETLVPFIRTKPQQIVLIGDHRQLQPIVPHNLSKQLGLVVSLLQRYCELANFEFVRLRTQYRMHQSICEFPNTQFYDGDLETAPDVLRRQRTPLIDSIWPGRSGNPKVLCHIVGKEETLTVTNEEGSEQSKKNMMEVKEVVRIAKILTTRYGVRKSRLQILSQYSSQCFEIRKELTKAACEDVDVSSVIGFQGSEKDYVILSTVRSLPEREIEHSPTKGWLKKNLGFVTDEHQINVALTRAQRGLIIVGNTNLLRTDKNWRDLINHYNKTRCVVNARMFPFH
ncbi:3'-5' exoribonuclease HELZ2-like [Glandiceps talaboti]